MKWRWNKNQLFNYFKPVSITNYFFYDCHDLETNNISSFIGYLI